jgi:hypothetical protein
MGNTMVTLRHEIETEAPPEKVCAFFENIEQNYTKWYPDHRLLRWVKGEG